MHTRTNIPKNKHTNASKGIYKHMKVFIVMPCEVSLPDINNNKTYRHTLNREKNVLHQSSLCVYVRVCVCSGVISKVVWGNKGWYQHSKLRANRVLDMNLAEAWQPLTFSQKSPVGPSAFAVAIFLPNSR